MSEYDFAEVVLIEVSRLQREVLELNPVQQESEPDGEADDCRPDD